MSVRITDCTIRDGGYLLSKNSNPSFVRGIICGLVEAGIDFVETGFLQNQVNGESIVYRNAGEIVKYLPVEAGRTNYLGFCDNSRYSVDNLEDYDGSSFRWLRISFAKHEIDGALQFCEAAQKKGYIVQFNPMDTVSYTEEEIEQLIEKVNQVKPGAFSIVDTFGAMYMDELERIFVQVDRELQPSISIGLHAHDNLGLSCALAERMIELAKVTDRDIILDGSLFGMGRGAGNAKTELLADYLNKKMGMDYKIPVLLETIDKYVTPLIGQVHWGYDLPMYICGTRHAHVDNVYHLKEKFGSTPNEMYDVMGCLTPQQRTRYGNGYSKTDFSVLDKIYRECKG